MLLLTACSSESEVTATPTNSVTYSSIENDYAVTYLDDYQNAREWHGKYLSRLDQIEIPKRLQAISKEYFDVNEYSMSIGQVITKDDIIMLQRHESSNYPYALNPELNSFKTKDGEILASPYIVSDIVELDFYDQDQELSGMSLAIVLNNSVSDNDETIILDDETIYNYASIIGRKLELYLRNNEEVSSNMPIVITFYRALESSSYVPGNMIGKGIFEGRSGQFEKVDQKWLLIPSNESEAFDNVTYTNFNLLKSKVNNFLPENVGIIAYAFYNNESLAELDATVSMQAKTYTEIYSLAELIAESAKRDFSSLAYEFKVNIQQDYQTVFTIYKAANSKEIEVRDLS